MNIEVLEYRLPDYLACYLINGDADSITDAEKKEIDEFLEKENIAILDMLDDSSFYWANDLNNMGGNCSTYTAHNIS